jgi:hypothetical protein
MQYQAVILNFDKRSVQYLPVSEVSAPKKAVITTASGGTPPPPDDKKH